jgi:hypothetical protein
LQEAIRSFANSGNLKITTSYLISNIKFSIPERCIRDRSINVDMVIIVYSFFESSNSCKLIRSGGLLKMLDTNPALLNNLFAFVVCMLESMCTRYCGG